MDLAVAATFGGLVGFGLWLAAAGWRGQRVLPEQSRLRRWLSDRQPGARTAAAVVAGGAVGLATGWPVAGLLAAVAVLGLPKVLGGAKQTRAHIARTEAIATWTELLRDTIAGGAQLQQALVATAEHAPAPIADEVATLGRRVGRRNTAEALAAFSEEVSHPSADLVVAALTQVAAGQPVRKLGPLLSRLADSIREDAKMRTRVATSRTKVRTGARIILGILAVFVVVAGLATDYLAAYDTAVGQAVLATVGAGFAAAGWLLYRLGRIQMPQRFSIRTEAG